TYVLGHAIEQAQHQQNNPAPAPTAPAAPPIPVVRSRATPHSAPPVRPSAPPPPPAPARVTPVWVAPASTPTSSKTPLWVGLGAAAVIVVLIIAAVSLANSDHNTTSAPGTTTTQAWPYPTWTSSAINTPTAVVPPPSDPDPDMNGESCNGYAIPNGSGFTHLGRGSNRTSCPFAKNVLSAYVAQPSAAQLSVGSPRAACPTVQQENPSKYIQCDGNNFIMICVRDGAGGWTTCTGGNDAKVYLY
ncbi:MAG TPA: hypothetical protein VML93_04630, partial [Mycobacterium sp.]|nr:hypothetical protein [Mycobacterium sp.]